MAETAEEQPSVASEFEAILGAFDPKNRDAVYKVFCAFRECIGEIPNAEEAIEYVCKKLRISRETFNMYANHPEILSNKEQLHRLLPDGSWLRKYYEYTLVQESPEEFHIWVGLMVLSATLNRRLLWGSEGKMHWQIWPNLYVFLVSGPAVTRKSTAIRIGVTLFHMAFPGLKIINHSTPEKLISLLSEKGKAIDPITNLIVPTAPQGTVRSQALVVAPELKTVLGRERYKDGLADILTELFDCEVNAAFASHIRNIERLKDVYVSFLAATTPEDFGQRLAHGAKTGGFISRVNVVVKHNTPRRITRFEDATFDERLRDNLIHELHEIYRTRVGTVHDTTDGALWFQEFTEKCREEQVSGRAQETGQERLEVQVRKVAILLTVSEKAEAISRDIYERALAIIIATTGEGARMIRDLDRGPNSQAVIEMLNYMKKKGGSISRTNLQRSLFYKHGKKQQIDEMLTAAIEYKLLKEVIIGKSRFYQLTNYTDKEKFA